MNDIRKYPIGIQDFATLREDGYLYVDKTALIHRLVTEGKVYFLNRPRRFGKSLLLSTLAALFEGRRELFEEMTLSDGTRQPRLAIADMPWDWTPRPVLRFDFGRTMAEDASEMQESIQRQLTAMEKRYGLPSDDGEQSGERLIALVEHLHQTTKQRVVVLVDEYDNTMIRHLGDEQQSVAVRREFQRLFSPLKSLDPHLEFVFITGITKFAQMGVFSTLNHIRNIGMTADYETICGITEQELTSTLHTDVETMAEAYGISSADMMEQLKQYYDGYHFSTRLTDVYNPFSVMNAFSAKSLGTYWFESGTTTAVVEQLSKMPQLTMEDLEGTVVQQNAFDAPVTSYVNPQAFLYQSGYLTIKDCEMLDYSYAYTLGFPNKEVRLSFADCLYQYVTNDDKRQRATLYNAYKQLGSNDDMADFMEAVKTFYAGVPYMLDNANEAHYHVLLYTLLVAFGADISAEEPSAKGRADLVLKMPKTIYVIEIKYDKPVEEALSQIDQRGYARKYDLDGRRVVKLGIVFSSAERNVSSWRTAE